MPNQQQKEINIGVNAPHGIIDALLWRFSSVFGRTVYRLLREHPDRWLHDDEYWLISDSGKIKIWIANKAYGLRIRAASCPREIRPPWADCHLIWREVKRRRIPPPEQFRQLCAIKAIHAISDEIKR